MGKKRLEAGELNYDIQQTLGTGGTCKVKVGYEDQESKKALAVKLLFDEMGNGESTWDVCKNEIELMATLDHPNVVKQIGYGKAVYKKDGKEDSQKNYIALEIAKGGELFDFISHTGPLTEPQCRFYFQQFMEGLSYCHDQGVAHRDLKPENLLLDENFNLKIADFGFSKCYKNYDEGDKMTTILGTPQYMAPEQHQKKEYIGTSVDIFAAGVILFMCRAAHPPFGKATAKDAFYKFIGGKRPDLFWKAMAKGKDAGHFSEEFMDLVQEMLNVDKKDKPRINMEGIKNHPWYTSDDVPDQQALQQDFDERTKNANADMLQEKNEKRAEQGKKAIQKTTSAYRGKIEDGSCFAIEGDEFYVKPKKELKKFDVQFKTATSYVSCMNPDDLENIIGNFLKDNDTEAQENLIVKEGQYKIKYNTIQDKHAGPIDVVIQVFTNEAEETKKEFPYVVEFKKGQRGTNPDFAMYFNEIRGKCFEENIPKEKKANSEEVNEEEKE